MTALITGASSGIGRDMAEILSQKGYDLILVARRRERLEELQRRLKTSCKIITADLSDTQTCIDLHNEVKDEKVEVLINNAGYGVFGAFDKTDLKAELHMIDTNIKAVHILTKLFLKDMEAQGSGYILNVASSAAFQPGPLFSSYYASKAYVLRLTQAIFEELRRKHSGVHISALCPGPVDTEFNSVAGVQFSIGGLKSRDVAAYALDKLFAGKPVIVPGTVMKLTHSFIRLIPDRLVLKAAYHIQRKKEE